MPQQAKYVKIFESLHQGILGGDYQAGRSLPSEVELAAQFGVSRPTVAHALAELERLGLVERRVGSGTYVRAQARPAGKRFGLLIPELEDTEIFGPIYRQIVREIQQHRHALIWGESIGRAGEDLKQQALQLCQDYIDQHVAGVFFAPIELIPEKDAINHSIADQFGQAGVPLILLDRDITSYPERSIHDLISIDHRRGGFLLAQHLLGLGKQRVDYVAPPFSAPTVALRIWGYQEALWQAGITPQQAWIHIGDVEDLAFVRHMVEVEGARAFICANDVTAAHLINSLDLLDYAVPAQVSVVGFDDVKYARLLRVPLTTIHQPCTELGTIAARAMLERLERPHLAAREILVTGSLIVRKSCGAISTITPTAMGQM